MDTKNKAEELQAIISRHKKIIVQTHDFPDPDAIATAFGLCRLIEHFGAESGIIYCGEVTRAITTEMIETLGIPIVPAAGLDLEGVKIMVVDGRVSNKNVKVLKGDYIGEIDHHPGKIEYRKDGFTDVRPEYGAAATIVAEYYKHLGITIEQDVATALAVGINVDTMRFIRQTTIEDIRIYAFLYPHADTSFLEYILLNNIEIPDLRLFQRAIKRLTIKDRFAYTDIGELQNPSLLAIICDFLLTLKEIEVMVVVSHTDHIFLSVRSEDEDHPADAAIAAILGGKGSGGGHRSMAAGALPAQNRLQILRTKRIIRRRFFKILST